jgi:plastocyanin
MRGLFIAGLTLLVASCSSMDNNNGSHEPGRDITIKKNAPLLGATAFSPANLTISLAQKTKVTWFNGDISGSGSYGGSSGTSHRLASDDGTTFISTTLAPGDTFSAIFHITGTFTYHCEIHPTMTGTVTVNP